MANSPKKDLGMILEDIASTADDIIDNVSDVLGLKTVHTKNDFKTIFNNAERKSFNGDRILKGLIIMSKYIDIDKTTIIGTLAHDTMYTTTIDSLIEKDILKDDVIKLRELGFCIDDDWDGLVCYN